MNKYFLLAALIGALIAFNIYLLMGNNPARTCYKNACLLGEKDPVKEINALVNSSNNAIIFVEGDVGNSQRNELMSGAMVRLAANFGGKQLMLITLGFENGIPAECDCERQINATGFVKCSNDTAACIAIMPNETSVMLKLSYPNFAENRILVFNRTIEFQGKSGEDALALVTEIFERVL